jgi:hypothetical protein
MAGDVGGEPDPAEDDGGAAAQAAKERAASSAKSPLPIMPPFLFDVRKQL